MFTQSLSSTITETINDDFGRAKYLEHNVIIMRKNGYVNITKLCQQYGKLFKNWLGNGSSKELCDVVSSMAGIPATDLMVLVKGGQLPETQGTYVHPRLAPHIASWISPKVGVIVADIVNDQQIQAHQRELAEKNQVIAEKDNTIAEKDNTIAEKEDSITLLRQQMEDMMRELSLQNKEIKEQNKKITEQNEEIKEQNEEIKDRVIGLEQKLDYATDEYVVPPKDKQFREACAIMKNPQDGTYYVIRRQLGSLQTQINVKRKAGFVELLRIDNPNSVNLLVRLKENYKGKVKVIVNTVHLIGQTTEDEFVSIVHEIDNEKKTALN